MEATDSLEVRREDNQGCLSWWLSIAEEDHLRKGQGIGMRDCQLRRVAADGFKPPRRAAMQLQLRGSAAPDHFNIPPEDASRMAGTERLHRCFLGGKASGKVDGGVAAAHTVSDLGLGENAVCKPLAVALDRGGNARDVCRVKPDSDDVHAPQA